MRFVALLIAFCFVLGHTSAANAHASLIHSEPADHAMVARAPDTLTLTFNEPVSPISMRLIDASGATHDLAQVAALDATLTVRLPSGLPQGTHLLSWRVVSADGHPVGGTVTFSVGQPSAAPQAAASAAARWPLWLAKLGIYIGLFAGIGGVFYGAWISRAPLPDRSRRIVSGALTLGLFAAVISIGLQGVDALGEPAQALRRTHIWLTGLGTSYGWTASIIGVALAIAMAALRIDPWARLLSALALTGGGVALAASGHASTAEPQWLMRASVFLHVTIAALWGGALVPLAFAIRRGEGAVELARFSRLIPLPFVAMVACGLLLAVVQTREIEALWSTSYGVVLSAKLLAVLPILACAAYNRRLTPHAMAGDADAARRLGLSIKIEIALLVAILGLVACWRFTPPPRALIDAAAAPLQAHIHTARAMANIKVERTRSGARVFTIVLLDGEFGPLAAKEVTLILAKPEAGIEPLRLNARHVEETIWRIDDVRLPVAGRWRAQVDILVSDFEKIMIGDDIDLPR